MGLLERAITTRRQADLHRALDQIDELPGYDTPAEPGLSGEQRRARVRSACA
ncbi:MAG: hypothetical protein M3376_09700 [Actinomycetota bacterium]|nr:hypothetical protein [Actinomycetota bacterium]